MVKNMIQHREGIPPNLVRLVSNGHNFHDDDSCEDYGIRDESIFHYILKLPGGGRGFYSS